MTARRAAAAVGLWLLLDLVALGAWRGAAVAAPEKSTAQMDVEAWYQQVPPCVSLVDCSVLPAASPYPEETLHVGVSGGNEMARTYLAFSLSAIPAGGKLTGGTLTLPVDTEQGHGSFTPDQADMVACMVTKEFEPVRGSAAPPPPTECKASAPAVFQAEAQSFAVDLAAFASRWDGPRAALALLPADTAAAERASWHVAFKATQAQPPAPITAELAYTAPKEKSSGPPTSDDGASGGTTEPGGSSAPPAPISSGGSGGGGIGSGEVSAPPVAAPPSQTPVQPAASGGTPFLGGFAGSGFAYPQVWALPLTLLAGIGGIGRALTKELYRRL